MEKFFYENIIEHISDGIYFVDINRKIIYWNKAAERITGYSKDEVVSKWCGDKLLSHVDKCGVDLCNNGCPLQFTLDDGNTRESEVYLHHKSGHRVPVFIRVTPIYDKEKNLVGAAEVFYDISMKERFINEMERLKDEVFKDTLTGVWNRKFAENNIVTKLYDYINGNIPFSLLFIDIDFFKNINDKYGHLTGDKVLQMVAKTISSSLRSFDNIYRWGGEEFVVVVSNVDIHTLESIAERMRLMVEKSWLDTDNETINVTISIGGTMAESSDSLESLIERADKYMYISKMSGRNCKTIR